MAKVAKPAYTRDLNTRQHNLVKPVLTRKRKLPKPDKMTAKDKMTPVKWQRVIEAISTGMNRIEAAKAASITVAAIEGHLITNVAAFSQLRQAQLVYSRLAWPTEKIEAVMIELSTGITISKACRRLNITADQQKNLYPLLFSDKGLRKLYDEARKFQAENFVDQLIDIADDTDNDRLENGRPNNEVVNRSKLKVDTRKWIMGKMVNRRFGERKQIDLSGEINVNHAAVLTGGRKRVEQLHAAAEKAKPVMIENGEVLD